MVLVTVHTNRGHRLASGSRLFYTLCELKLKYRERYSAMWSSVSLVKCRPEVLYSYVTVSMTQPAVMLKAVMDCTSHHMQRTQALACS